MAILYPRKQTVMLFIICLAAVLGTSYYVNRGQETGDYDSNIDAVSTKKSAGSAIVNSFPLDDSDWKSQFAASVKSTSDVKEEEKALTMTERFGRDFFARFIVLKQNDLLNDKESIDTVIDQSMDGLVASAMQPKIYFKKDILIAGERELQDEKTYLNRIGMILVSKLPHENASLIASQALDDNDPSALSGINEIVTAYANITKELKILSTPSKFEDFHLDLLNGISAMHFVSEGMNKVFSDPVTSLLALNSYGSAQTMLRTALLRYKDYILQSDLFFAEEEGGYLFLTIN